MELLAILAIVGLAFGVTAYFIYSVETNKPWAFDVSRAFVMLEANRVPLDLFREQRDALYEARPASLSPSLVSRREADALERPVSASTESPQSSDRLVA